MKTIQSLPEGYEEVCSIDLQNNKKQAVLVNGIAILLMASMYIAMQSRISFMDWMDQAIRDGRLIPAVLIIGLGTFAYVVLHEFTHGAAMKLQGGKEVKYGFTGLYAFAGSRLDYFPKKSYVFIALAPVVIWGVLFAILQLSLPAWSWPIWFLQMMNVSGAAGDLYVSVKTGLMSPTILVMDTGVSMTVYDKAG